MNYLVNFFDSRGSYERYEYHGENPDISIFCKGYGYSHESALKNIKETVSKFSCISDISARLINTSNSIIVFPLFNIKDGIHGTFYIIKESNGKFTITLLDEEGNPVSGDVRYLVFMYPDSNTNKLKLRTIKLHSRNSDYIEGFEGDQFKRFSLNKVVPVNTATI